MPWRSLGDNSPLNTKLYSGMIERGFYDFKKQLAGDNLYQQITSSGVTKKSPTPVHRIWAFGFMCTDDSETPVECSDLGVFRTLAGFSCPPSWGNVATP